MNRRISCSVSYTHNLGNFRSMKFDAGEEYDISSEADPVEERKVLFTQLMQEIRDQVNALGKE